MSLVAPQPSGEEEARQRATGILVWENWHHPAHWFIDCFHSVSLSEWFLKTVLWGRWAIDLTCFTDEETSLETLNNCFLSMIMADLGREPSVHFTLLQSSKSGFWTSCHLSHWGSLGNCQRKPVGGNFILLRSACKTGNMGCPGPQGDFREIASRPFQLLNLPSTLN